MTFHAWLSYTIAVFLLISTPGPNMLFVMSNSVRYGARESIPAMAGCWTAIVLGLIASAIGLGAILVASPTVFTAIRYVGAIYLFYLGIKACRDKSTTADLKEQSIQPPPSRLILFRNGFAVGVSNPKFYIFASAFFPQFVHHGSNEFIQFTILIVTFASIELFWYLIYSVGGQKLAILLKRPKMMTIFNYITGTIFIGFACALLISTLLQN